MPNIGFAAAANIFSQRVSKIQYETFISVKWEGEKKEKKEKEKKEKEGILLEDEKKAEEAKKEKEKGEEKNQN